MAVHTLYNAEPVWMQTWYSTVSSVGIFMCVDKVMSTPFHSFLENGLIYIGLKYVERNVDFCSVKQEILTHDEILDDIF